MKTRRMIQFPSAARRGFLAAVLVAAPAAVPAVFAGSCLQATVDEQVALPDGSVYPPGQIRICVTLALSPVADLNTISVGGRALGKFVGRRRPSEGGPEGLDAVMVFERRDGAGLRLIGFGLRDRDRFAVTSFGPPMENLTAAMVGRETSGDPNPAAAELAPAVVIAASAR